MKNRGRLHRLEARGGGGRRRGWLGRGLLVLLGALAGLALAELGLRVLGLAPPPGLFTVTESEYQRLPGTFSPGQRVTANEGTPFEHVTSINQLGYRGANFPRTKPPGQSRVLYAGDSFTWGHNVNDGETTPARLQAWLEDRCGPTVVANAGLSGTSILAQEAIIERGLVIDPDAVVLMYHENDIDELMHSRIWDQLAANRRAKSRFPVSVLYPVVRSSALWNMAQHVRRVVHFRDKDAARTRDVQNDEDGSIAVERARAEYRARLEAIKETLDERGIPIVFVAFPHPESVTEGRGGRDYDWILAAARDLDLPVLDLLRPLQNAPLTVPEAYLVPDDYHPSPAGHAFAATVIGEFLMAEVGASFCLG